MFGVTRLLRQLSENTLYSGRCVISLLKVGVGAFQILNERLPSIFSATLRSFASSTHSCLEVLRYWNKTQLVQCRKVLHLKLHFISRQVYHDSEEGQRYIQFYKLNKFPYISILDPRTGESCPHFQPLISVQSFYIIFSHIMCSEEHE